MSEVQLYLGDCLSFMRTLPDNYVDIVVTDPPYGAGIAEWDMDIPPQEILDECLRVSSGPVIWFGGRSITEVFAFGNYSPRPDRLLFWHVTFSLNFATDNGIYYKWHPIWCWRLPKKQSAISRDVLEYAVASNNGYDHPAKKPEDLMIQLVSIVPQGATVLDPYMGSGTTIAACIKTGRNAIGCDNNPDYFAMSRKRATDAQRQYAIVFGTNDQLKAEQLSLV